METNIYQSDLAIHPGEYLEEVLEDLSMSQSDLSHRIDRPAQMVNEIINGKKSITPTTALQLEDVLGVPAHIWTGLENEYQMVLAKELERELEREETKLLVKFPYLDLSKMGLVKETRKAIEKVEELKRFFKVSKLSHLCNVKAYEPAFRISNHKSISHEAIAAWIRTGVLLSEKIETKVFNKTKLNDSLVEIKNFMNLDNINDAISKIKNTLADCGVAFVMQPHFAKTKVYGATLWANKEKAVLIMTIRGGFSDLFWFNLFHEIGHILLHNKREIFLEDGYSDDSLEKQENEANNFAKNTLIDKDSYKEFIKNNSITTSSVQKFAKTNNIKVSIIVGRLMHEEIITYKDYKYTSLRDRYSWTK
ncbi:HigA family addiction module antitoxin [Poseidonibacter ostreae]|uniref:HigA family addiction module antidote protein n=1 Tax=Poseidonibacter ostreae TaxID=2654171 RepID=A0A6L4WPX0_9BACT|nr:HigA family addiction module antitoxin [Poseidonibacter ostreae]KAB7885198.1 HigA family addiction module antidote protein [Poseidonibacter ostreae]KAB7886071.1 HigA family addiction module antidote protein [Poseidonibacter ostreae]KAB7889608.1 HigA family addiction module antidote protein [Poseidonibacter ostreae]